MIKAVAFQASHAVPVKAQGQTRSYTGCHWIGQHLGAAPVTVVFTVRGINRAGSGPVVRVYAWLSHDREG